jgi:hypothetical protein
MALLRKADALTFINGLYSLFMAYYSSQQMFTKDLSKESPFVFGFLFFKKKEAAQEETQRGEK